MTDLEERRAQRKEEVNRILSERKKARLQKEKRRKLCITLPTDVYVWLVSKVNDGTYYNLSHGLEMCVKETRRHQTKKDE